MSRSCPVFQQSVAVVLPSGVVLQTDCHEYLVFGGTVQRAALAKLGITDVTDAAGCCGVAANFGFEREHCELSMKVAENALAPALRSNPGTAVHADGFSCAMKVRQLDAARPTLHLARLLDPAPPSAIQA